MTLGFSEWLACEHAINPKANTQQKNKLISFISAHTPDIYEKANKFKFNYTIKTHIRSYESNSYEFDVMWGNNEENHILL